MEQTISTLSGTIIDVVFHAKTTELSCVNERCNFSRFFWHDDLQQLTMTADKFVQFAINREFIMVYTNGKITGWTIL